MNRARCGAIGCALVAATAMCGQVSTRAAAQLPLAGQPSQSTLSSWYTPVEPFHIAGPIYFVGTQGLGVYLLASSGGHILIGGAMPGSTWAIESSIRKLDFDPDDIRVILINHAHADHVGTVGDLKEESGAMVMAMDRDLDILASGGAASADHVSTPWSRFLPVHVDRALIDGTSVELGDMRVTARLTPGHTPGSTTYEMTVREGSRSYLVVFADGAINTGVSLDNQVFYPTLLDDSRQALRVMTSLVPDIWLTYHTEEFEFRAKWARSLRDGPSAFVDPAGYRRYLADRSVVLNRLARQPTPTR